jgi:hypothetical protein
MDLAQTQRLRKHTSRIAALFFFLVVAAVLDGCIAKFREPVNVFDLLPGTKASINGPLPPSVKVTTDLAYLSNSPDITVSVDALQTGYWFGGNLWVGTLSLAPRIAAGEYDLRVFLREAGPGQPTSLFKVRVYGDYASFRASFRSMIRRYLDISPWWFIVSCLPFLAVSLGCVYLLSQKIETLMALEGKAEVYLVRKTEAGYDIGFALGASHGVNAGSKVSLYDDSGRRIGTAVVRESRATDSLAAVDADVPVRQGCVAVKEGATLPNAPSPRPSPPRGEG